MLDCSIKHVVTVVNREHSVETKGHGGARVRLGLLDILDFLPIFVTLQSQNLEVRLDYLSQNGSDRHHLDPSKI